MSLRPAVVSPELFITVKMAPPPRPMLCGFTREVQSSAAMAPSTAEPPDCRMSLEYVGRLIGQ